MPNSQDYLPRDADGDLLTWSESANRKPLVLRGARQTGKSSTVRRLGRRFDLFLELNLERFDDPREAAEWALRCASERRRG